MLCRGAELCLPERGGRYITENPEPSNRRDSTSYLSNPVPAFVRYGCTEQTAIQFALILVDEAHMGCATDTILNRSFIFGCMAHSVLNNQPVCFSSSDNLMAPLWWFSGTSQL